MPFLDYSNLWNTLQPFRFVEQPAVCSFITYLNPKINDNDIPRKSWIAVSVNAKVAKLKDLTHDVIDVRVDYVVTLPRWHVTYQHVTWKCIPSKVSIIWDGWSTRKHWPYTSFSISFIDSPQTMICSGNLRSIFLSSILPLDDTPAIWLGWSWWQQWRSFMWIKRYVAYALLKCDFLHMITHYLQISWVGW